MSQKVDDLDLKILRHLQEDARKSYRDIAEKLDVAEGTVYNRVNKLLQMGVIRKFGVEVDYGKLGYDLLAVVGVVVEGGKLQDVEEKLSHEPNVTAVYDVTGEYDTVVVARFKDRTGLNRFIKALLSNPAIKKTYTMMALNVVKEESGVRL
ncbi:MAG: Lrp/AsnC family transcriptional regulator [Halobacteria archaeon]